MKILISIFFILTLSQKVLSIEINNKKNINLKNLEFEISMGSLKNVPRQVAKEATKKISSKNTFKPSKNFNKYNSFKKEGAIKSSIVKNTDSFNWGYNPSFIAMSRGVKEIYENDRESYDEMTTWYCPPNIKYNNLEHFSSIEERCVAYQMSCNVKIFEQNSADELIPLGSGFFVNPNTIITNNHVVTDLNESIIKVLPYTLDKKIEGNIIAYSENHDLAVITVKKPYNFPSCEINKINNPKINANVIAIGSPKDRKFDLTKGIIEKYLSKDFQTPICTNRCYQVLSANEGDIVGYATTYRNAEEIAEGIIDKKGGRFTIDVSKFPFIDTYWIQMNAYITYGSSGGPLYHQRKIVGVNTLKYNDNNMSIHFSKLMNFLSSTNIENHGYYYSLNGQNFITSIRSFEIHGE